MATHAITVTLKPKYYSRTIGEQYHLVRNEIEDIQNIEYNLIFELTSSFNVHAHGIVKLKKVNRYSELRQLYDIFRRCISIGFVCIKPIDDIKKWTEYCYKDKDKHVKKLNIQFK